MPYLATIDTINHFKSASPSKAGAEPEVFADSEKFNFLKHKNQQLLSPTKEINSIFLSSNKEDVLKMPTQNFYNVALQSGVNMNDVAPVHFNDGYGAAVAAEDGFSACDPGMFGYPHIDVPTNDAYKSNDQIFYDKVSHNKAYLDRVRGFKSNGIQIRVLGVSQNNAKSRVETQIKICIQLVTEKGGNEDKIQTWSHLKLPEHLVVKDKPRGRKDADGLSLLDRGILEMEAIVICASDPSKIVQTCSGCVQREKKRVKKKEMMGKKSIGDEEILDDNFEGSFLLEQSKIILFNCSRIVDFSSGDTILPSRITCYCRHHSEKLGFCIYFILRDYTKNIIATGISPAIMITDDHKSSKAVKPRKRVRNEEIEDQIARPNSPMPDKRLNQGLIDKKLMSQNRQKSLTKLSNLSTGPSLTSLTSLSELAIPNGMISPSLRSFVENLIYFPASDIFSSPQNMSQSSEPISPLTMPISRSRLSRLITSSAGSAYVPSMAYPALDLTSETSSSNGSPDMMSQIQMTTSLQDENTPIFSLQQSQSHANVNALTTLLQLQHQQQHQHRHHHQNQQQSQQQLSGLNQLMNNSNHFLALTEINPLTNSIIPNPVIMKVIPSEGPMHGGLEITVLGSGFYDGITAVFGDNAASSTQVWNQSTIVCILPPSVVSGPVPITIKEHPTPQGVSCNFLYTDDLDRSLLELALKLVGLRMTGKVDDARNIAMRIFSDSAAQNNYPVSTISGGNSVTTLARLHLLTRNAVTANLPISETEFENIILQAIKTIRGKLLSMICLATGHTLLHLAIIAKFNCLATWLIRNSSDLDAVDMNGFSALHFSAMMGSLNLAHELVFRGADTYIQTKLGFSVEVIAKQKGHNLIVKFIRDWKEIVMYNSSEQELSDSNEYEDFTEKEENDEYADEIFEFDQRVYDTTTNQVLKQQKSGESISGAKKAIKWSQAFFKWPEPSSVTTAPSRNLAGPHTPPEEPVDAKPLTLHQSPWMKTADAMFSSKGSKIEKTNNSPDTPAVTPGWYPFAHPGMTNFSIIPSVMQQFTIPNLGFALTMQDIQIPQIPQINFPAMNLPQFNLFQFLHQQQQQVVAAADPAVAAMAQQQNYFEYMRFWASLQGAAARQQQQQQKGASKMWQKQQIGNVVPVPSGSSESSVTVVESRDFCNSALHGEDRHHCAHNRSEDNSSQKIWIPLLIAVIAILLFRIFNDNIQESKNNVSRFGVAWAYNAMAGLESSTILPKNRREEVAI
ncbi:SPT3 Dosage dependent suppressor of Ty-induced promoter mutations-like protein, partial [Nowakowskiella sp. JEL0078]